MVRRRYLSKKQVKVLNDLFKGELDEQEVLEKHKVWRTVYDRWLEDERFLSEFEKRMRSAHRHSELVIARYAGLAATKLMQLTKSDSQETARKACLDIIGFHQAADEKRKETECQPAPTKKYHSMPPELAERILAAMAEAAPEKREG